MTHPEILDPASGIKALFIDRENIFSLPESWTEDSPGFYILLSHIKEDKTFDALVGKVIKGFSGMLNEHDKTKSFWHTAILVKTESGIGITQSAYLEGKMREILSADESVTLWNIRAPWDQVPSSKELKEVLPIIDFTLQVLSIRGYLRPAMSDKAKSVSQSIRKLYSFTGSGMIPLFRIPMPPQRPIYPSPVNRVSSMGKKSMELNPELTKEDTFTALKAWRANRATMENVPAYVIMNNRTLEDIAFVKPTTTEELLHVPGMGKKRVDLYGSEILEIISSAGSLVS